MGSSPLAKVREKAFCGVIGFGVNNATRLGNLSKLVNAAADELKLTTDLFGDEALEAISELGELFVGLAEVSKEMLKIVCGSGTAASRLAGRSDKRRQKAEKVVKVVGEKAREIKQIAKEASGGLANLKKGIDESLAEAGK